MRTGRHKEYWWLESASWTLHDLLAAFPEVVTGKCLAIASCDSGPLKPTGVESERDWLYSQGVAYIPRVSGVSPLPFDDYEEWYVLDTCRELGTVETFVSHCGFGLSDPEEREGEQHKTWDTAGLRSFAEMERERQRLFWTQTERILPLSCILNGDLFLFITRDHGLYEAVAAAAGSRIKNQHAG